MLAPTPASSLRHLQSGEAEEELASHSHALDQHLSCHEPHKHKVVCNTWVFRPKEPATYRSHCCGGRAARGFIFDAAIQVGACWPSFQLCSLPTHGAGHLKISLPPAYLHSHCCCKESGLREAHELLGICENYFQTSIGRKAAQTKR